MLGHLCETVVPVPAMTAGLGRRKNAAVDRRDALLLGKLTLRSGLYSLEL